MRISPDQTSVLTMTETEVAEQLAAELFIIREHQLRLGRERANRYNARKKAKQNANPNTRPGNTRGRKGETDNVGTNI